MKRSLLTLLTSFLATIGFAQQSAQYSQYMFNSLVINPAYAGYKENLNVSVLHRNQWTGIKGSPKTQSVVLDGALFESKNVGLGVSIVNDKLGIQGQSSAYINYAYRLPVGENNARLAFGLAAGAIQYSLNSDLAKIDDPTDPNFAQKESVIDPDAKFGVYYSNDKWYAGFSVTDMLSKLLAGSRSASIARNNQHYFLTAGMLANLNENLKFKPSIMVRSDLKAPSSVDLNAFFLLKEAVWLGASYRAGVNMLKTQNIKSGTFQSNSVVGVMEVFVGQKFRLGYAYDYAVSDLNSYTNGTHEISLGLILNAKQKNALLTPRYF